MVLRWRHGSRRHSPVVTAPWSTIIREVPIKRGV